MKKILAMLISCSLAACTTMHENRAPAAADRTVVAQLAPSGTLRAAINFGNPILANKHAASLKRHGIEGAMVAEAVGR